jgi:AhpD family alkylhydroperoxidase
MLEDPKVFLESLKGAIEGFSKVDIETLKAFGNLNETALKPGALDRKTKTLMCIAIAIATRCEYCISARTAQAIQAGATREELIETASVGDFGSFPLGQPVIFRLGVPDHHRIMMRVPLGETQGLSGG